MKLKLQFVLIALLFSAQLIMAQDSNEKIAEQWIKENTKELQIQPNHEFEMLFNRKGPSGETLRYYQMINGVQVYDAELTIHINTIGNVSYTASTYNKNVKSINTTPNITATEAFNIATGNLKIKGTITQQEQKLYVYPTDSDTKLAYSIKTLSKTLNGYWETIVDAHTGNIISTKDVAFYYDSHEDEKDKKKKKKSDNNEATSVRATGRAMVFIPEPLSAAGVTYGTTGFEDSTTGSPAEDDTPEMTAARTQKDLPDVAFSGGEYHLRGQYAEIASLQNPNTGLFSQASSDFFFTREQDGFEAANVYYHLDNNLRYINETLGITLVSLYNSGVVRFDAHAHNGADQSTYGGGSLNFGEGGIDDAECADVVLHELGHGLHDWVTNGSLSQVNGLSEGSGDYWAQSYSRSVSTWVPADLLYNKVFKWDGNDTWNGRRSDVSAIYPGDLVGGGPHTDGQIWSTVLMEIYDLIGRTKIDAAFLEGLGMTNSTTNQQNAAIAVRQAAMDMVLAGRYGMTCADVDVMTARFTARGYTMTPLDCNALAVDDVELNNNNITIYPNPGNDIITIANILKDYNVEVFNIIGQRVLKKTITPNENTINISSMANGTYIVKLNNGTQNYKLIKI